jgi:hypothetical protein
MGYCSRFLGNSMDSGGGFLVLASVSYAFLSLFYAGSFYVNRCRSHFLGQLDCYTKLFFIAKNKH